MNISMDELALETFTLNESMAGKYSFDQLDEVVRQEDFSFPKTSGIVYQVERGERTFCIRGMASKNIEETILGSDDKRSGKSSFFETKYFELAEVLRDQMLNRRFSYGEVFFGNLDQLDECWWAEDKGLQFSLYFGPYGGWQSGNLIKLGPIGDNIIANIRFNKDFRFLSKLFSVEEFVCDNRSLGIVVSNEKNENFNMFKRIFLLGDCSIEFWNNLKPVISPTLKYYLMELATVRKFWMSLESILGQEKKAPISH